MMPIPSPGHVALTLTFPLLGEVHGRPVSVEALPWGRRGFQSWGSRCRGKASKVKMVVCLHFCRRGEKGGKKYWRLNRVYVTWNFLEGIPPPLPLLTLLLPRLILWERLEGEKTRKICPYRNSCDFLVGLEFWQGSHLQSRHSTAWNMPHFVPVILEMGLFRTICPG
jgi:hypothetical protein